MTTGLEDHELMDEGFSIFESLVAFLILSLVLGGTIQLLGSSMTINRRILSLEGDREFIEKARADYIPNALQNILGDGVAREVDGWRILISRLPGTTRNTAAKIYEIRLQKPKKGGFTAGLERDLLNYRTVGKEALK